MPALARRHRVHALSLPGHGDSAKPADGRAFDLHVRAVAGFVDALGLGSPALVGSSLGGQVALRLALDAPDRVSRLVLVDPTGLGRAIHPGHILLSLPALGDLGAAWTATPLGAFARPFVRAGLLFANPLRAPAWWLGEQLRVARIPGVMRSVLASNRDIVGMGGQRRVLQDRLEAVRMPTLVVWGAEDRIVPVDHGYAAVKRLPMARLAVIAGCGHLPHVERPEAFLAELTGFLENSRPEA
jgi:pimeloyl-ACP methyl ester carboxylesterase